jgi:hypothetical protein
MQAKLLCVERKRNACTTVHLYTPKTEPLNDEVTVVYIINIIVRTVLISQFEHLSYFAYSDSYITY